MKDKSTIALKLLFGSSKDVEYSWKLKTIRYQVIFRCVEDVDSS